MLSDRGLCDELITRPEESYRLWCVVCDLETSRMGAPYIYIYMTLVAKGLNAVILATIRFLMLYLFIVYENMRIN